MEITNITKRIRKRSLILGIVLIVIIFEQLISMTSLIQHLELVTYDLRAKFATDFGPFGKSFKHADNDIVIVTLDDYSRKEIAKNPQLDLGSFPWRRDVWAGVVDFIEKGEPKAILFDLIFTELNENSWNDRKFAQVLRKNKNVVLATSLNDPKYLVDRLPKSYEIENSDYLPTSKSLEVQIDDKNIDDAITFYSHSPVNDLYTKENTMGVVNKVEGLDTVVRSLQPIFKLNKNGEIYYLPSLSFAGFLKYMGDEDKISIKNNKIFYKDRVIPIDNKGQTLISWHGLGKNYAYIPISKVLLSEKNNEFIKPEFFKNKIIIIGRTEAGTDIHPSAVSSSYAGPETNAAALDNYINDSALNTAGVRKFITKMPPRSVLLMIIVICAAIGLLGLVSKNAFIGFLNSLVFIILYILFCIWMFANPQIRMWVPIVIPLYYLLMTSAIIFAYRFQKESAKRATVMNMFGKFVSPKVLTTLIKNQDNLVLKSTKKRITVLFCDIKDFTSLSEKCNPEQLVNDLNELFNEIVNIIFENNGTVDKFIGDSIMAYWGDPIASEDDAFMAVKTALEIRKKVSELKIKNAQEGRIIFDVKLGINTGEALLGLSGSEKIMSYTAMGDAVNIASRLETTCGVLNRDILISKSTYEDTKDKIIVLEAGKVNVKGKEQELEVYEPIGLVDEENINKY